MTFLLAHAKGIHTAQENGWMGMSVLRCFINIRY